jgi:hypothetical protein
MALSSERRSIPLPDRDPLTKRSRGKHRTTRRGKTGRIGRPDPNRSAAGLTTEYANRSTHHRFALSQVRTPGFRRLLNSARGKPSLGHLAGGALEPKRKSRCADGGGNESLEAKTRGRGRADASCFVRNGSVGKVRR